MDIEYPKSIQVLGHIYTVSIGIWESMTDENLNGDTNHRTQEIRINEHRPPSQQMETFLHEILHIVSRNLLENDCTEYQIRLLAKGLSQALQSAGIKFISRAD